MLGPNPESSSNTFRRRRIWLLNHLVERVAAQGRKCTVIDIGGTYGFWQAWRDEVDWTKVAVVSVNLDRNHIETGDHSMDVRVVHGDARKLDFVADNEFDIAFSNSVIEHVGMWSDMLAVANEIRRVAPRYLVQTPYFWFPIEPHARVPLIHWLPESLAYRILLGRSCGFWPRQTTVSGAVSKLQSARLIDLRQMEALFPDATIVKERFAGLIKSLMAVKQDA
jgi:hypothetical protein